MNMFYPNKCDGFLFFCHNFFHLILFRVELWLKLLTNNFIIFIDIIIPIINILFLI